MSEQLKVSKTSSVQGYESAWLGRWNGQSNSDSKRPQDNPQTKSSQDRVEVLPFPMFKVSQKRDNNTTLHQAFPVLETKDHVASSSQPIANRVPWMYAPPDKHTFCSANHLDFPIQEKTTQNLLELIRPMRIYATLDSVQRVSGELNLPEEDGHQLLRASTVSMKLKGKLFGGYLDLFPTLVHQHNGGVRLQSLESSKDTEDGGPRKNESSTETDTLEMDGLQMIHLSGSISSSSTKGKGRKDDSAIPMTGLPDMNEEPPLVPDREDSVDGHQGETSNSATQSMNVDHFMSRECKRVQLVSELEPSSRWVKRLKTNASDSSGHDETKSLMNIEGGSPGQKGNNNLFLEILKSGINNLQPRNQELVTSQRKNLNRGGEDITLLHPWIQRWCKKKTTSTDQPEVEEVSFGPESRKEMEKKHFPSIGAMALMGKALSGLNPYGLRKTDSVMVWNARNLR